VTNAYARKIVDGVVTPSQGAHKLWLIANDFWGEKQVFAQLAIFVGLGSEWDDHEQDRAQIVQEAEALLAAGGLHID
jgi:hypothetical protein